jgi:uncharacterized membrane protein
MTTVEKTIEVDVPVKTAYNQWTQFEQFPEFMEGVKAVSQIDDTHLHWVAKVGGEKKEWDAHITQQVPDKVIAWESDAGASNAGIVSFRELAPQKTEISLHMELEPHGVAEQVGSALGVASSRIEGDLKRFKEFIEARGAETGSWRGEVTDGTSPDLTPNTDPSTAGSEPRHLYGATGQGGAGYGGTAPGGIYPGTPGTSL